MDDDLIDTTSAFGFWLGAILSGLTFIASWVACWVNYGFLFGFGLGWLPSGILAAIVFAVARFLWRIIAFIILVGAIVVWIANS
jgi:hypothetical protein